MAFQAQPSQLHLSYLLLFSSITQAALSAFKAARRRNSFFFFPILIELIECKQCISKRSFIECLMKKITNSASIMEINQPLWK